MLKSGFNKLLQYLINCAYSSEEQDEEKTTTVSTIKLSERQQNYLYNNHQEFQRNGVLKLSEKHKYYAYNQEFQRNGVLKLSQKQKNYGYNYQEFQRNGVCRRSF